MIVKVKKVKDGYLIPSNPVLDKQDLKEIMLEIRVRKAVKKSRDEKSYKELRDEAIWERYLEKEKREVPSRLTKKEVDAFSRELGLDYINSIDDIIKDLKGK